MGGQGCYKLDVSNRIAWGTIVKLALGGAVALLLPREGLINGSTRIIPFFALLMAGVLPAMMQTVTVLRGDDLSPKEILEYKGALRELFNFWSSVFGTALSAVGFLTLAVIIYEAPKLIPLVFGYWLDRDWVVDLLLFSFGVTTSSLTMRFARAFGGLRSLLILNFSFAEKKGEKNAQAASKRLTEKAGEPAVRLP